MTNKLATTSDCVWHRRAGPPLIGRARPTLAPESRTCKRAAALAVCPFGVATVAISRPARDKALGRPAGGCCWRPMGGPHGSRDASFGSRARLSAQQPPGRAGAKGETASANAHADANADADADADARRVRAASKAQLLVWPDPCRAAAKAPSRLRHFELRSPNQQQHRHRERAPARCARCCEWRPEESHPRQLATKRMSVGAAKKEATSRSSHRVAPRN